MTHSTNKKVEKQQNKVEGMAMTNGTVVLLSCGLLFPFEEVVKRVNLTGNYPTKRI